MDFGLFCWSICRKLARIFYLVACRMKRLFKQLSLLVSVRNAVAQVTSNEQQTTPESIEMGNVRPSSLEIPSEYEHYCPHEEPLPVEPLPVYKP
ncbi:hypothetical protein Pdw03_1882 [Penicillium digitatum]|uniref:Uncharacterized protein n=1 Tax=Penicillium digitatum TaxID=36651 RepID=A0A7T7BP72_PENDI|nr:hypothetical protein Pdw03_1882 [Penicillium digitatum]